MTHLLALGAILTAQGGATFLAATLRWQAPAAPATTFKIEAAAVDTTPKGVATPVWTAVGTYDAAVCGSRGLMWLCGVALPDTARRYRVQRCTAAGCSGWAEEAVVACVDPGKGTGCPCGLFPAAAGCIP